MQKNKTIYSIDFMLYREEEEEQRKKKHKLIELKD